MEVPDLIQTPLKAQRVVELATAYDHLSDQVPLPSLQSESIYNVFHLLGFWMRTLPQPFMHRTFTDALSAWCVEPCRLREKEFKYKIHTRRFKVADGEYESETDTEAEALSEEDEACAGLPSFNSRRKRIRRRQRAVDREQRRQFARRHPELVISNRPSHKQRRVQMYRELHQLETPQVNHARLVLLLIAPHCFSTLVYLLTFLASLLDHPENKVTAKLLADKYAWKLFGGPNKDVVKEVMEWLLTRWSRITQGYMSNEARAWFEKKTEEQKHEEPYATQQGAPSSKAPSQEKPKDPVVRDQSSRMAADSTHSDVVGLGCLGRQDPGTSYPPPSAQPKSTAASLSRRPARRQHNTSRKRADSEPLGLVSSANPVASKEGPRRRSLDDDKSATQSWETAQDTVVISPIKDEENEYKTEREHANKRNDENDGWAEPQRTELEAIEALLSCPKSTSNVQQRPPSVHSTTTESVYSQGTPPYTFIPSLAN